MIKRLSVLMLVAVLAVCIVPETKAGDAEQVVLNETLDGSFGKVWRAVKRSMEVHSCGKPQTEKVIEPSEEGGLYKGIYISDFCILATGEDTTRDVMERYGDIPRIRGGMWISGRIQYKINIREEAQNKTKITLKAELSGFEEFITNQVHFWTSNGVLERAMMAAIVKYSNEEIQKAGSTDE